MAMATVIWAAAAEVIIMDGAEDAVITTAGHAVIIVTITVTDIPPESTFGDLRRMALLRDLQSGMDRPVRANKGVAMPALIGYMLAIVITLGGYFAALNWLIRPPDPWQSSAKIPASTAQHVCRQKATTRREACGSRQR